MHRDTALWLLRGLVCAALFGLAGVFFARPAYLLASTMDRGNLLYWAAGPAVFGLLYWLITELPKRQAAESGVTDAKDLFEAENEARRTVAQIIGGVVVVGGLAFTYLQYSQGRLEYDASYALERDKSITELFTRANELMGAAGEDKLAARLGGIFALERIAYSSKDDHLMIMRVLTTFVRDRSPSPGFDDSVNIDDIRTADPIRRDVLLAVDVMERRNLAHEADLGQNVKLDLSAVTLHNHDFSEAELDWTNFNGSHLESAIFNGASLAHATFELADLDDASLVRADLSGANLKGAQIVGARFHQADLSGANLEGTGITVAQLRSARTYAGAILPNGMVVEPAPTPSGR